MPIQNNKYIIRKIIFLTCETWECICCLLLIVIFLMMRLEKADLIFHKRNLFYCTHRIPT